MKNKKVHKLVRMQTLFFGIQVRPVCKVDNKTWAYNKTTVWHEVTCLKCLKGKK